MIVSRSPVITVGLPARALASRHAALSGSTTTMRGQSAPRLSHRCAVTAPARAPTPPWMKTCVGNAPPRPSCSSASCTITE